MRFEKSITRVIEIVLEGGAISATKYFSPDLVVRAVRRRFGGKILSRCNAEIVLTIGKPNYREREFIKECQRAKETFPISKIQIKWPK